MRGEGVLPISARLLRDLIYYDKDAWVDMYPFTENYKKLEIIDDYNFIGYTSSYWLPYLA